MVWSAPFLNVASRLLSELTAAKTRAPNDFAKLTAAIPTPPDAPSTKTFSWPSVYLALPSRRRRSYKRLKRLLLPQQIALKVALYNQIQGNDILRRSPKPHTTDHHRPYGELRFLSQSELLFPQNSVPGTKATVASADTFPLSLINRGSRAKYMHFLPKVVQPQALQYDMLQL